MLGVVGVAAGVAAAVAAALVAPAPAAAHPAGPASVNQYAGLRVGAGAVDVDYVLDLAERPASDARRTEVDQNRDGAVSPVEGRAYAGRTCAAVAAQTGVGVDGRALPVTARAARLVEVGRSIRLECWLRAEAPMRADSTVEFRVGAFADRAGWHEITAVGDRVTVVRTTVPADSVSTRLAVYPPGLTPPDVRSAALVVRPGGPAAGQAPGVVAADARADLAAAWLGGPVGRLGLGLAVGLLALLGVTRIRAGRPADRPGRERSSPGPPGMTGTARG